MYQKTTTEFIFSLSFLSYSRVVEFFSNEQWETGSSITCRCRNIARNSLFYIYTNTIVKSFCSSASLIKNNLKNKKSTKKNVRNIPRSLSIIQIPLDS